MDVLAQFAAGAMGSGCALLDAASGARDCRSCPRHRGALGARTSCARGARGDPALARWRGAHGGVRMLHGDARRRRRPVRHSAGTLAATRCAARRQRGRIRAHARAACRRAPMQAADDAARRSRLHAAGRAHERPEPRPLRRLRGATRRGGTARGAGARVRAGARERRAPHRRAGCRRHAGGGRLAPLQRASRSVRFRSRRRPERAALRRSSTFPSRAFSRAGRLLPRGRCWRPCSRGLRRWSTSSPSPRQRHETPRHRRGDALRSSAIGYFDPPISRTRRSAAWGEVAMRLERANSARSRPSQHPRGNRRRMRESPAVSPLADTVIRSRASHLPGGRRIAVVTATWSRLRVLRADSRSRVRAHAVLPGSRRGRDQIMRAFGLGTRLLLLRASW